jgi:hypothetical protein
MNDNALPPHASRLLYLCDFTRMRGDADAVVSPPVRTLSPRPQAAGKAAM